MSIGGKARNAMVGVTVLSLGVLTADVFAGGAKIPDQSTRAMGMMDAFAAGADDASAVYYNPAGLTSLKAPEVITNLYVAHANVSSDGPAGNDTSDGKIFTIPNLYLATPVKPVPGLAAGFGVYTPFGLGSRWSQEVADKWAGSGGVGGLGQATRESEIQLMDFNPAVAYSPVKGLSLGAGVDYYRSKVIQRFSQNYGGFGIGESELEATGDGWGYNLGAQWACTDAVKFGLTYRSAFVINYDGTANYRAVPGGWAAPEAAADAKVKLRYPQSVTGGVSWQATEKLRLEADAEWMDWSEWDRSKVTVSGHPAFPAGVPVIRNTPDWQDSWILMLGAEYEMSERWTLRCGYAWNQTCVPRERADVDLPTGDSHALAMGAGYRVTSQLTLDAALILVYGMPNKLDSSSAPAGTTFDAFSTYASLGATYRF